VQVKIDAHQHFWAYDPLEYGWIGPEMDVLKRDYMPQDLEPLQHALGITGTVAVQARQTVQETRWLIELAHEHAFIKGVVGWVDLFDPELGLLLETLASHPKLCGVRHVVQDEPDDEFMLRDGFCQGIRTLTDFDLTYDILIFPRHLPAACELVSRFPQQRFVLDHIAKPPIKSRELDPWREWIWQLAEYPNVYCKVSGMVTEADWANWQPQDVRPYLDVVFEAFGTQRIMIGSDWPVCTVAGTYSQVMGLAYDYLGQFSTPEQADLCGGNAQRFYRLAH
jgi:L-fuconolactonase